jgi:hypothetical protein
MRSDTVGPIGRPSLGATALAIAQHVADAHHGLVLCGLNRRWFTGIVAPSNPQRCSMAHRLRQVPP